jgi:quercetin 2,3-dioxygenase
MNILPASSRFSMHRGPFKIDRLTPGGILDSSDAATDTGLGGLGLIDHAHLEAGLLVGMHEHRNDEIISYLRHGEMIHRDTQGDSRTLRRDFVMVMNAGSGISHEESVPSGTVEMLQIFIRPVSENLPPRLQFHDFSGASSANQWRSIAGPTGQDAPLQIRQQLRLFDTQLEANLTLDLPMDSRFPRPFLYVFDGAIRLGESKMNKGDAATWNADEIKQVTALENGASLVLFLIDMSAPASRSGTLSGGRVR